MQALAIIKRGRHAAHKQRHARVLFKADQSEGGEGDTDAAIAEAVGCSVNTVAAVRQRFVEQGFDAAIGRKKASQPPVPPKLDGRGKAELLRLACSKPPEGHATWTLQMLADRLVALGYAESLSYETVRQRLKKNEIQPHRSECWVIPPKAILQQLCLRQRISGITTPHREMAAWVTARNNANARIH